MTEDKVFIIGNITLAVIMLGVVVIKIMEK